MELKSIISELQDLESGLCFLTEEHLEAIKAAWQIAEKLVNIPEGGLAKIKVIEILHEMRGRISETGVTKSEANYSYFADKIIHEDKLARIVEKQATTEWIKSLKESIEEAGEVKLDLRVVPVLEELLKEGK